MQRKTFSMDFLGNITFHIDYKAPHANRPTPPRKHFPRKVVNNMRNWSPSWGRGGTIDKRMFS